MAEYINKQDATHAVNVAICDLCDYPQRIEPVDAPKTERDEILAEAFRAVIAKLDGLPRTEIKEGKWETWETSHEWIETFCSVCHKKKGLWEHWDYCPHCGAKMEGE